MHICCANCSLYPVQKLTSKGVTVKGLWFNPNIHPYTEYGLRLNAVKELSKSWNFGVEFIDNYGLKDFIEKTNNGAENRCEICYETRLNETAKKAAEMKVDGFTTSMLVSPYQKFDTIIDIGKALGKRYSVPFYMEDFRPGWNQGVELSKELGLYRQKYCGCIYSEMERYNKKVPATSGFARGEIS